MKRRWICTIPVSCLAVLGSMGLASGQTMDQLVAGAKKEGQLTVIALPRDWCSYGTLIDDFKKRYDLAVNELNPDAGSGDEIEAIKANKGNTGPQAPDVIDVGLSLVPRPRRTGCCRLTRSRPGARSRIPRRTPRGTGTATTTACWRCR
ncbi:MAG TPA: hypothetical protein VN823_29145 [Stellaceae bacterium]|nr:hypothetical protein [Stellaceae bacterium]